MTEVVWTSLQTLPQTSVSVHGPSNVRARSLEALVPYVTLQHKAVLLYAATDLKQACGKSWDHDEINYYVKPTGPADREQLCSTKKKKKGSNRFFIVISYCDWSLANWWLIIVTYKVCLVACPELTIHRSCGLKHRCSFEWIKRESKVIRNILHYN